MAFQDECLLVLCSLVNLTTTKKNFTSFLLSARFNHEFKILFNKDEKRV